MREVENVSHFLKITRFLMLKVKFYDDFILIELSTGHVQANRTVYWACARAVYWACAG